MKRTRQTVAVLSTVALAGALAACGSSDSQSGEAGGSTELKITTNAIAGGKNAAQAEWIEEWVIPNFEKMKADAGAPVKVIFEAQGVDDEDYKTKLALDLQSGGGADIIGIDGIWTGEFAEAQYIKPLEEVAADSANWDGWQQIPEAVQQALSFEGKVYGVPQGADGRVLYYNKDLFKEAGLPEDWQPKSWDDVLDAGRALKALDGVTPIQLNAGTAMGEATTMQGVLPMLAGTGELIWEDGQWMGDTSGLRDVLNLYKTIYVDEGLGDPILQQEAAGRDNSFQMFADKQIGILLEGDYFWRSVINPEEGVGTAPMADRDTEVGYTLIPAMKSGEGVFGQDYVSMSGGAGRVLNPNSKNPDLAWELLAFMNSPEAIEAQAAGTLTISARDDVNKKLLSSDPMLTWVSENVLPITAYRPGLAEYPQVSTALQQATLDVVTGGDVESAASTYLSTLEGVVGADSVRSS
ncbi:extracellular solute-binding protein [Actinomycetaceae bacterium WB03_NA08]|uniref:Extracellular solute-binding protein n=1 Tax=Scrofimicrobium canadense TaxID=2652290 RepID=A0A6N7VRL2_9ACTO|nr:extracellular solute-binding protein [Scrofimicrobium canadense]MSS84409.1 extracellular solute-binding protein [Scrofimicrobium canadense]